MSLFGKICVGLLVILAAYVFWPRDASLDKFLPQNVAAAEIAAWQALRADEGFNAVASYYALYTTQFGMGPVQALNLSSTYSAAIQGILKTTDAASQAAFEPDFIEAGTLFIRETRGGQDGPALGRGDFNVWGALAEQEDLEKFIPLVRSQLRSWSGLPAEALQGAAEMRARALQAAFTGETAEMVDWDLVAVQLAGSWAIIKDLLAKPVAN